MQVALGLIWEIACMEVAKKVSIFVLVVLARRVAKYEMLQRSGVRSRGRQVA